MRKTLCLLVVLLTIPFVYAAVDTLEGTAITTANDVEGTSAALDDIDGSEIKAAGGACSTPSNGDILDEGFLDTGYENSWTEDIGSGGTIDEDHTLTGTPPTNSCSEGLLISASEAENHVYFATASTIDTSATVIDVEVEFLVQSGWTLDAYSYSNILAIGTNTDYNFATTIRLRNNGGSLQVECNDSGTRVNISADTWYTAHIHIDTEGTSYFTVTGGGNTTCDTSGDACAPGITDTNDIDYVTLSTLLIEAGEDLDVEFGYVYVDTP